MDLMTSEPVLDFATLRGSLQGEVVEHPGRNIP